MTTHKKCEVITCRRIIVGEPEKVVMIMSELGQKKKVHFQVCKSCDKMLSERFAGIMNNPLAAIDEQETLIQILLLFVRDQRHLDAIKRKFGLHLERNGKTATYDDMLSDLK